MASLLAIAQRRAVAINRLESVKSQLVKQLGLEINEQPITNRDDVIAQIQQVENTAHVLEEVSKSLDKKEVKTETEPVKVKPAAKKGAK